MLYKLYIKFKIITPVRSGSSPLLIAPRVHDWRRYKTYPWVTTSIKTSIVRVFPAWNNATYLTQVAHRRGKPSYKSSSFSAWATDTSLHNLRFVPFSGDSGMPFIATWWDQQSRPVLLLQKPTPHSLHFMVTLRSTRCTRLHQMHRTCLFLGKINLVWYVVLYRADSTPVSVNIDTCDPLDSWVTVLGCTTNRTWFNRETQLC